MKLRFDFVTNSSSSSFVFVIDVLMKSGESIRLEDFGGEEGGIYAYVSPRQLAKATSISHMIEMLKNGIFTYWDKKNSYFEENADTVAVFLDELNEISCMDDIASITIAADEENRTTWRRQYSYDLVTDKYSYTEEGERITDIDGESGGDLDFEDYGLAKTQVGSSEEDDNRKRLWLKKYGEYVSKDPIDSFEGKNFVFTGLGHNHEDKDHPAVQAVIARGGEYRSKVSGKTDYLIVDPADAGDSKIQAVIEQLSKGKNIKVVLLGDLQQILYGDQSASGDCSIDETEFGDEDGAYILEVFDVYEDEFDEYVDEYTIIEIKSEKLRKLLIERGVVRSYASFAEGELDFDICLEDDVFRVRSSRAYRPENSLNGITGALAYMLSDMDMSFCDIDKDVYKALSDGGKVSWVCHEIFDCDQFDCLAEAPFYEEIVSRIKTYHDDESLSDDDAFSIFTSDYNMCYATIRYQRSGGAESFDLDISID